MLFPTIQLKVLNLLYFRNCCNSWSLWNLWKLQSHSFGITKLKLCNCSLYSRKSTYKQSQYSQRKYSFRDIRKNMKICVTFVKTPSVPSEPMNICLRSLVFCKCDSIYSLIFQSVCWYFLLTKVASRTIGFDLVQTTPKCFQFLLRKGYLLRFRIVFFVYKTDVEPTV